MNIFGNLYLSTSVIICRGKVGNERRKGGQQRQGILKMELLGQLVILNFISHCLANKYITVLLL